MQDKPTVECMARDCKQALLSTDALRVEHHVNELLDGIRGAVRTDRPRDRQRALFDRHREYTRRVETSFWRRTRALGAIRNALVSLGARRFKRILLAQTRGR
jgi:hypothetical protein